MKSLSQDHRIYLLDNLKGILMFLVVFGHSLELYKNDHYILYTIYTFIYLFHMPAFIFISGYLSKNLDKSRDYAFKTFLIPFVLCNTLWNIFAAGFTQDVDLFSFITPGWSLWYLLSMFFWRTFLKDLVRVRYIIPLSFIIGLGAGIFNEFNATLSLSRTLVFLPFFLMGYFTSEEKLFRLKKPTRLFSFLIILFGIGYASFITYSGIIPVEFLYGSESFTTNTMAIWLGLLGRIAMYIIGFSFVFVLANTVTNKSTFFSKIGKNTFPIYLLHTYLLLIIFGINRLVPILWVKIIICFVGSIVITSILSRNIVNDYFNRFFSKFNTFILKKND